MSTQDERIHMNTNIIKKNSNITTLVLILSMMTCSSTMAKPPHRSTLTPTTAPFATIVITGLDMIGRYFRPTSTPAATMVEATTPDLAQALSGAQNIIIEVRNGSLNQGEARGLAQAIVVALEGASSPEVLAAANGLVQALTPPAETAIPLWKSLYVTLAKRQQLAEEEKDKARSKALEAAEKIVAVLKEAIESLSKIEGIPSLISSSSSASNANEEKVTEEKEKKEEKDDEISSEEDKRETGGKRDREESIEEGTEEDGNISKKTKVEGETKQAVKLDDVDTSPIFSGASSLSSSSSSSSSSLNEEVSIIPIMSLTSLPSSSSSINSLSVEPAQVLQEVQNMQLELADAIGRVTAGQVSYNGNRFNVGATNVVMAMTEVASILGDYGVTYDETNGLQQNGEKISLKVAMALKRI